MQDWFCALKTIHMSDMNPISIADILVLPVLQRIRLVELIWDSVATAPDALLSEHSAK